MSIANQHLNWWHLQDNRLPLLSNMLSARLKHIAGNYPNALPDLSQCRTLLIASDYGGDKQKHQLYRYQTFSFLVVDLDNHSSWNQARTVIRNTITNLGERTMSYKGLANDELRQAALIPFLRTLQGFKGLTLTVAIDHNIPLPNLLQTRISGNSCSASFSHWDRPTLLRFQIVAHLLSLLTRGLSHDKENIIWVTDNDNIAQKPLNEINLFGTCIMQQYVPWYIDLGWLTPRYEIQLHNGSTLTQRDLEAEDYVAIPDLLAGVFSDWLTYTDGTIISGDGEFILGEMPERVSSRVKVVLSELSAAEQALKHIYVHIGFDERGKPKLDTVHLDPNVRQLAAPIKSPPINVPRSYYRHTNPADND